MMNKYGSKRKFLMPALMLTALAIAATLPANAKSVKDYGAVGDGKTDDTDALQRAFDHPDRDLVIDQGEYLYTRPLHMRLYNTMVCGNRGGCLLAANKNATLNVTGAIGQLMFISFKTLEPGATAVVADNSYGVDFVGDKFYPGFASAIKLTNKSRMGSIDRCLFMPTLSGEAVSASNAVNYMIHHNDFRGLGTGVGVRMDNCRYIRMSENKFASFNFGASFSNSESSTLERNQILSPNVGAAFDRCKDFKVASNEILYPKSFCLISHDNSNMVYSGNVLKGGRAAIHEDGDQDSKILNNQINKNAEGIIAFSTKNVQMEHNSLDNISSCAIDIRHGSGASVHDNVLQNVAGKGIFVDDVQNPSIVKTMIRGTNGPAIVQSGCKGSGLIEENKLENCGLAPSNYASVLYADSPGANSISITNNEYSGNTKNLEFYIRAMQPQPKVLIFGNKTDTLLPTKTGV